MEDIGMLDDFLEATVLAGTVLFCLMLVTPI